MKTAAEILIVVVAVLSIVVVLVLFVWAARHDGAEDRAVHARLGIRRRRWFRGDS